MFVKVEKTTVKAPSSSPGALRSQDGRGRRHRQSFVEPPELIAFISHLLSDRRSRQTARQYRAVVRRFLLWVRKAPRAVTVEDLEGYKTYLSLERQLAVNTLYNSVKGIQAFYRFLEMDVAKELRPPRRRQTLPKYLSEHQVREIFETSARLSLESITEAKRVQWLRNHTILVVLAYTGLRVSELCAMNVEDVDFREGTIRVQGKGDKQRLVVFESQTRQALQAYLPVRILPDAAPNAIFASQKRIRLSPLTVERIVAACGRKAGLLVQITPHTLRHTMATTLLKNGADIRIIQQLLGHSSIATTQIYTHVDRGHLKGAYDDARPRYGR